MTTTTKTETPAKLEQLRKAYDIVYGGFTASRSEVAAGVGVSNAVASRLLNKLRDVGLMDAVDVNDELQGNGRRGAFKELEWQCHETYDSISASQATYLFDRAFGLVVDPPEDIDEPEQQQEEPEEELPPAVGTQVEVWAPAFADMLTVVTRDNSQSMFAAGPWCRLCERHFTDNRDKHARAHTKELERWRKQHKTAAPSNGIGGGGGGGGSRSDIAEETLARLVALIEEGKGITTVAKVLTEEQHKTATGKTTWHAAGVRTLYLKTSGKSHLPSKMTS